MIYAYLFTIYLYGMTERSSQTHSNTECIYADSASDRLFTGFTLGLSRLWSDPPGPARDYSMAPWLDL